MPDSLLERRPSSPKKYIPDLENLKSWVESIPFQYWLLAALILLPFALVCWGLIVLANTVFLELFGGCDLSGQDFRQKHLPYRNLVNANLSGCNLSGIDLSGRNLCGTNLTGADLSHSNLAKTNLRRALLRRADLSNTNLFQADLSEADLTSAQLNEANIQEASFEGCKVFGLAAWGVKGENSNQKNLIITKDSESIITVDGLRVANLLYIMLQGDQIGEVIDAVSNKSVLVLGRFNSERLLILKAVSDALRAHNYIPILVDFEKPASRNIMETVSTIAHMSRFIVADLTEANAVAGELRHIINSLIIPIVPIYQPYIDDYGKQISFEWDMFWDLSDHSHVLPICDFSNLQFLIDNFEAKIILPAEEVFSEILRKRQKNNASKLARRARREENSRINKLKMLIKRISGV